MNQQRPLWRAASPWLYWAGALVGVVLAFRHVVPLFYPFVVALITAMLIEPAVRLVEQRLKLHRAPAVALVLLFFLGALGLASFLILSRLVAELARLYSQLPLYQAQATELVERILEQVGRMAEILPVPLQQALEAQWVRVYQGVEAFLGWLTGLVGRVPNLMVITVFSLMGTYFVSRDKDAISRFFLSLLPPGHRGKAVAVRDEVIVSVLGFVKAQVLLVLLTIGLNIAGLMVLNADYAVVIGLIAGLLDILPVVGPAIIFLPWALYALIYGDVWLSIGLLVLYTTISMARQAATARLVSEGIGVHPLATLIALYLGVRLLGPIGLIVGPLVAVVAKAMINAGLARVPTYPTGSDP